jgi:hypothetical protein
MLTATADRTAAWTRWAAAFAIGAAGGSFLDQLHVGGHVLEYANEDIAQQAWWVAPQFGIGTLVVLLTAGRAAAQSERVAPVPGPTRLAVDFAWFVGAYAASALVDPYPGALATAMFVTWLARVWRRPDRRAIVPYAVALAAAGTLWEGFLAGQGAFTYLRADAFNVPLWLPGLYLHGAPLAVALRRVVFPPTASGE